MRSTGKAISVPVGKATLGRIMDVLGKPQDEKGPIQTKEFLPIHRAAPAYDEQAGGQDLLVTGIKVIELLVPFAKGGKLTITASTSFVDRQVPVVLTAIGYGAMTNLGAGNYTLNVTGVSVAPDTVTVRSSKGGQVVIPVTIR